MKFLTLVLLFLLGGMQSSYAAEPAAAAEGFMTSLYKRLAKNRNAVLIDAPAEDAARLGTLYMYQEPKCFIPASGIVKNGTPISLDPYTSEIDVGSSARTLREPKQFGSYSLNRGFASELVADMKKNGVMDANISASALIDTLTESKLSFRVIRTEVDYLLLHRMIKEKSIDLSALPSEYEGIVVPISHFSITDFKYDNSRIHEIGARFGLGVDFLDEFFNKLNASFSAKKVRVANESVEIDSSATFAFKPNVLMSRHSKCSIW